MNKTLDKMTQQLNVTQLDVFLTKQDTSATRENVAAMQKESAEKQRKESRKNVTDWLSVSDCNPSSNFQAALKRHEPGTGQWLLDGVRFRQWKRTRRSFMWLYGIRKYIQYW
jgi:hypothetical protein